MESFLRDLVVRQCNQGDNVVALVHSTRNRLIDEVEHHTEGFTVRRCARWFTVFFAPFSPLFGWTLIREIKRHKPQVIHCHMPNASVFWLLLLPRYRSIPWVIHWQSDVLPSHHKPALRFFYSFYKPFERAILSRSHTIIVSSEPYLASSIALRNFASKCIVEPLFIDENRIPKAYLSAIQPVKAHEEGVRLLCVGRLTYYKSFDTAIRAIAKLPNCTLRILGGGEEYGNLAKLISSLKLSNRVELLGEVPEVSLWENYVWCDVLCLPSIERTEAFGLVILEAAAFGKPSLVADTQGSGMSWLIEQVNPRGLSFRAGDPDSLADQVGMIGSSKDAL